MRYSILLKPIILCILFMNIFSCNSGGTSIDEDIIGTWEVIGTKTYIHDDGRTEEFSINYIINDDGNYTVENSLSIAQNTAILSFPSSSGLWSFDNIDSRIKFYKTGPNGVELLLGTYYWNIITLEDTDNNLPYLNVNVFDQDLNQLQELELEKID